MQDACIEACAGLLGAFGPVGPALMVLASIGWGLWQRRGRVVATTKQKQAEAKVDGMRVAVRSLRPDAVDILEGEEITETIRPPALPTLRK